MLKIVPETHKIAFWYLKAFNFCYRKNSSKAKFGFLVSSASTDCSVLILWGIDTSEDEKN